MEVLFYAKKYASSAYHFRFTYVTFTHAGLTCMYRTKSLYKSIFMLSRARDILYMKIESLLNIAFVVCMKFQFKT